MLYKQEDKSTQQNSVSLLLNIL